MCCGRKTTKRGRRKGTKSGKMSNDKKPTPEIKNEQRTENSE